MGSTQSQSPYSGVGVGLNGGEGELSASSGYLIFSENTKGKPLPTNLVCTGDGTNLECKISFKDCAFMTSSKGNTWMCSPSQVLKDPENVLKDFQQTPTAAYNWALLLAIIVVCSLIIIVVVIMTLAEDREPKTEKNFSIQ